MRTCTYRDAVPTDLAALDTALRHLSSELGDPHRAGQDALGAALFGTPPLAHCCLAEDGGQGLLGLALDTPVFSTARGGAGLFVTDLWVVPALRNAGLGRALLRATAARAGVLWNAGFLRLIVHDHNPRARAFYDRLGFAPVAGETALVLTGPAFDDLRSPS